MAEASDNNGAGDSMDIVPPEVRPRPRRSFSDSFLEIIFRDTWSHFCLLACDWITCTKDRTSDKCDPSLEKLIIFSRTVLRNV